MNSENETSVDRLLKMRESLIMSPVIVLGLERSIFMISNACIVALCSALGISVKRKGVYMKNKNSNLV